MAIDFKALAAPFKYEELDWRMLRAGVTNNNPWGFCAAFVNARAIMNRLDTVCGPENWQSEFTSMGKGTLCKLSIRVNGEWVFKMDGAEETDIEAMKGGISKALVRAAVSWGIGRYLYDLPQMFADFGEVTKDTDGARYAKIDGKSYYWLPPHKLPAWALPEGERREPAKQERPKLAEAPSSGSRQTLPQSAKRPSAEFVVPFGMSQGKKLGELNDDEIEGILDWFKGVPDPKGKAMILQAELNLFLRGRVKQNA